MPEREDVFLAAFTSQSWTVLQASQTHSLIQRPALPFEMWWPMLPLERSKRFVMKWARSFSSNKRHRDISIPAFFAIKE